MGQAKNRGTQEQRASEAKEKIEALKPAFIVCNACKAEVTNIHAMDTRGMNGIQAVFSGLCTCDNVTYAMLGDKDAVTDLMLALESSHDERGMIGVQKVR
jgi:hypothetical protein